MVSVNRYHMTGQQRTDNMNERPVANSILAGIVMITAEHIVRVLFEYFGEEHIKKTREIAREEAIKLHNELLEYQRKVAEQYDAQQRAVDSAQAAESADAAPACGCDNTDAYTSTENA